MFKTGHKPAHAGKITTTEPIRGDDIQKVRQYLESERNLRDLALWSVAVNCALRASELLSLRWDQIEDDGERITFRLREKKTGKLRLVRLNRVASADLRRLKIVTASEWCFASQRGGPLGVPAYGRMVKHWALQAGVNAKQVASHTCRKTWVRSMLDDHQEPLYKVSWALGHASERQTAAYAGLLFDEVAALYEHVV